MKIHQNQANKDRKVIKATKQQAQNVNFKIIKRKTLIFRHVPNFAK